MPAKKRGLQRPPQAQRNQAGDQARSSAGHPLAEQVGRDDRALVVPLSKLLPSISQPRQSFDEASIAELAADIEANGLINPLTVFQDGDVFRIVAGERRYRALVALDRSDAAVRVIQELDSRAVQLAENLQREDLPLMEEAQALASLRDELNLSVRALAERVKKSTSYVDRRLQVLNWPEDVQEMLRQYPGLLTKAAQVARIENLERRQRRIAELLNNEADLPQRPPAHRGRPTQPFKVVEKRHGGFDLQVKYRPGQTDREDLIRQLRTVLDRLEGDETA